MCTWVCEHPVALEAMVLALVLGHMWWPLRVLAVMVLLQQGQGRFELRFTSLLGTCRLYLLTYVPGTGDGQMR